MLSIPKLTVSNVELAMAVKEIGTDMIAKVEIEVIPMVADVVKVIEVDMVDEVDVMDEVDAVDEVDVVAIAEDTDIYMIPTSTMNCTIGMDTVQRNVGQSIEKLMKQNLAISI
jgi:hypothetical protein